MNTQSKVLDINLTGTRLVRRGSEQSSQQCSHLRSQRVKVDKVTDTVKLLEVVC